MSKSKCPVCGSLNTVKNGKRKGVQTYKCRACGYQFRNTRFLSDESLWRLYLESKQTIKELSAMFKLSESTIKRRLRNITKEWTQPPLSGGGYVHLDVTYWGHNWGVILALDEQSGHPLYMSFVGNETAKDYREAINSIKLRGYEIRGIIIDGKKSLFSMFSQYNVQMCQFHMKQIVKTLSYSKSETYGCTRP